jgi:rhodanese-related sulfurtransferase
VYREVAADMKSSIRPLAIIVISLFGFLLIVTIFLDRDNFKYNAQEMHQIIKDREAYVIDSLKFAEMSDAYLVDIRNPEDFIMSNDRMVNIPLAQIIDEENAAFFKNNATKVLFAEEPLKAHEAWMLLTQMGYEDLYVLAK